jgi:hypothetical protein
MFFCQRLLLLHENLFLTRLMSEVSCNADQEARNDGFSKAKAACHLEAETRGAFSSFLLSSVLDLVPPQGPKCPHSTLKSRQDKSWRERQDKRASSLHSPPCLSPQESVTIVPFVLSRHSIVPEGRHTILLRVVILYSLTQTFSHGEISKHNHGDHATH